MQKKEKKKKRGKSHLTLI